MSLDLPVAEGGAAERWGMRLIWLGAMLLFAGMFLKPAPLNAGLVLGLAGILLARRREILAWPTFWCGLALSLWLLLTVALAVQRDQPMAGRIPGLAFGWLAIPVAALAVRDRRWLPLAVRAAVIVAAAALVVSLLQFFIGIGQGPFRIDPEGKHFARARGFSDLSLTYGFVGSLLLLVAILPEVRQGCGRAWTWTGRILGGLGLLLSGARGPIAGLAAGLVAASATRGRRWLLRGLLVATALVMAAGVLIAIHSPARLTSMLAGDNGRWAIWRATAVIIADHPVVGCGGRDAFSAAYPEAFARTGTTLRNEFGQEGAPHAHSTYLAMAAEHGLPAVLLHLLLIGSVVVVAWRRRMVSPGGFQLACGVAVLGIIAGLTEPYASRSIPGLAFHTCLGLALGLALSGSAKEPAP